MEQSPIHHDSELDFDEKPLLIETNPEKRDEFLELIGDPAQLALELEESRKRHSNYDPGADQTFILAGEQVDLQIVNDDSAGE